MVRPHRVDFDDLIASAMDAGAKIPAHLWEDFRSEFENFMVAHGRPLPSAYDAAHIYACFFQLRRGFYYIYRYILGSSAPIVRLRAAVWQSIFTHDLRRYTHSLYGRMTDSTLLITGPSGTGKELVARAVGLSRYHPFNTRTKAFETDFSRSFHPVNLSALPTTLIESELFGHVKGAFTGAVREREGLLEECEEYGTVFLDEIGELDPAVQVKLLRVLQTREIQRIGETERRRFRGKVIAATKRDLAAERRANRFRDDLYYRLCSDMIATPSLIEQLVSEPEDLHTLILFVAHQVAGDDVEELADEVHAWIRKELSDYDWPGNFRELEQCVRNVMIRREYHPETKTEDPADPLSELSTAVTQGTLTLDELEQAYSTLVYAQTGSYREAARRLGRDWRTLKSKIDERLAVRFGQASRPAPGASPPARHRN